MLGDENWGTINTLVQIQSLFSAEKIDIRHSIAVSYAIDKKGIEIVKQGFNNTLIHRILRKSIFYASHYSPPFIPSVPFPSLPPFYLALFLPCPPLPFIPSIPLFDNFFLAPRCLSITLSFSSVPSFPSTIFVRFYSSPSDDVSFMPCIPFSLYYFPYNIFHLHYSFELPLLEPVTDPNTTKMGYLVERSY